MKPFILTLFIVFNLLSLHANQSFLNNPIFKDAKAYMLFDFSSGKVLVSHNSDEKLILASLTKLMTLHLLLTEVKKGSFSMDTIVPIPKESYASELTKRATKMGLGDNQLVNVEELLMGLSVASANDAGYALAIFMAKSIDNFTILMNNEAKRLGLTNTTFSDPTGLTLGNTSNLADLQKFISYYIKTHSETLHKFHNQTKLTYPKKHNMLSNQNSITYTNGNGLLTRYENADGLKTGYLDESGFNLVATAKKNDMRLVAIVLGVSAESQASGYKKREDIAMTLMDYGFANYVSLVPATNKETSHFKAKIYGSKLKNSNLYLDTNFGILLPKEDFASDNSTDDTNKIEFKTKNIALLAPFKAGDKVGFVEIMYKGKLYKVDVFTDENIEKVGEPFYFFSKLAYKMASLF